MSRTRLFVFSSTLLALMLTLGGCAGMGQGSRTTVWIRTPAISNEASKIKAVAVLPFDGNQGAEFATDIQGLLANVRLGDTPYFKIAERRALEQVYAEIKRSQSGAISRDQALRLGRLLGVKGLYTGTAGTTKSSQSSYQETRSTCTDSNSGKKLFSRCKSSVTTKMTCARVDVSYTFSPKLIDAETGQIVYVRTITGNATTQSCPDQQSPALSSMQLSEQAKQQAFAIFLNDVAPSVQSVAIQLLDMPNGIVNESARAKLTQGITFAVANRLDRACELWTEARAFADKSPALLYNLGVCAESDGNLKVASDLYRQADRLLDHPDPYISLAIERVEKAKHDSSKFTAQVR